MQLRLAHLMESMIHIVAPNEKRLLSRLGFPFVLLARVDGLGVRLIQEHRDRG
jgi:hypothetical protein